MFLFYTAAMTHMNMEMQTKHNSCTLDRSCDLLLDDSCSGSITAESLRYSSWIVFSAVILTTFFMGENVQCWWQKFSVMSETDRWSSPQLLTLGVSICEWLNIAISSLKWQISPPEIHLYYGSFPQQRGLFSRERFLESNVRHIQHRKRSKTGRKYHRREKNQTSNLCCQAGCRKSALFNLLESMFL